MEKEFDTIPISKLVIRLGVPAMLAQFFNVLYSIVDRAFIGHIPLNGGSALAGVGVCAPILTAITAFSSLIGIGGASVLSISVGKKDYRTAERAISSSMILLLGLSILLTILALMIERPLLFRLGCSNTIYPYASEYFRNYVLGTAAVLCGNGMNQFVLAQGNARRGMIAVIIGAIINTVLDPLFIYVFAMGVKGAAIATVIAQFCVMVYVLFFLFSDKSLFKIHFRSFDFHIVQRILTIGVLPFFILLFDNLLIISLNTMLRKYGGDVLGDQYLSCATVVQSFMVLNIYPAQGITTGCSTLYSYHYGAGNYKKVMQVFRYVFYLCAGYVLLLFIAAQTIPDWFAHLFVQDETIVSMSADCIQKYTLGILGEAVQYAIVDGLTAMEQIKFALPVSFFRKLLYIACVFLLPMFFPLENIFYAETISNFVGASTTALAFLLLIMPRLHRSLDITK